MRKGRKRRKTYKRTLISLVILLVFVVIIIALLQSQGPQKKPASEYFQISETDFLAWNATSGGVEGVLLREVYFNVSSVEGDAHNVYIRSVGMLTKGNEPWFETIEKGEIKQVILEFNSPVYVIKEKDGYPFTVKITSKEAEGEIKIYLTEGGILPPLPTS